MSAFVWTDDPDDPCVYDVLWVDPAGDDADPSDPDQCVPMLPSGPAPRVFRDVHERCDEEVAAYQAESKADRGNARVLVCGSRSFDDALMVKVILDGMQLRDETLTIIEGGAAGADRLAATWADCTLNGHEQYPADWNRHGKAAGVIRNQQMLDAKPDLVVAFVDKPLAESKGTADMVRRARDAGVPTYVVWKVTS